MRTDEGAVKAATVALTRPLDGLEAVATARGVRPDLIVMDVSMPKIDGWTAMRDLQSDAETALIPIVVLTAHDFKAYLKPAALAVGACSFPMKPCFPDQLEREISDRRAVRRHSFASAL